MKLSIIMPVYNEVKTIEEIIRKVLDVELDKELIIVDDGSADGTREYLRTLENDSIRIFYHTENKGKGAAIRTGIKEATGDIITIQDADLEYDPNEFPQLIELILSGRADVVYGSRFLFRTRILHFYHMLGNKLINLFANILYNATFSDLETCYKAFRADILKDMKLESNSFGFEAEVTAQIMKKKLRIYEVPISYYGRSYDEGKKITWKDGVIALYWLIRCKVRK